MALRSQRAFEEIPHCLLERLFSTSFGPRSLLCHSENMCHRSFSSGSRGHTILTPVRVPKPPAPRSAVRGRISKRGWNDRLLQRLSPPLISVKHFLWGQSAAALRPASRRRGGPCGGARPSARGTLPAGRRAGAERPAFPPPPPPGPASLSLPRGGPGAAGAGPPAGWAAWRCWLVAGGQGASAPAAGSGAERGRTTPSSPAQRRQRGAGGWRRRRRLPARPVQGLR